MFARTLYPIVLGVMLTAPAALAAAADADAQCRCRDPSGEQRDLGTVTCVRIGRGDYLVRCEMSTNTPYWRRLDDQPGCPLAS